MPAKNGELITHLNAVLRNKLTGINQYFLHARMLKHMGNVKLADYEYKSSIDIMKHSDMLVEHILSLGGIPNLQELSRLMIGETVEAMLANDLLLSEAALATLREALQFCEGHKEHAATAHVLRRIMDAQQEHIDFIHNQIGSLNSSKQEKDCA
jgi:bacterioferritin